MELYAAVMYRSYHDYEIILASEVPAYMLANPGRNGFMPSIIPGELLYVLCGGGMYAFEIS